MPKEKDLKSRWKDVLVALKNLFKFSDATGDTTKKILDQATVEQELVKFINIKGYNTDDPDFDMEVFQAEFTQYLKDQNYSFEAISTSLMPAEDSHEEDVLESLKKVYKVTEDLNDNVAGLSVF